MNSREYRQWRQRRRAGRTEANRTHPDTEAERLIGFASMWAPYGGAPEEEILMNFGMTRRRFLARLWQVIPESTYSRAEIHNLEDAYPRHRHGSSPTT